MNKADPPATRAQKLVMSMDLEAKLNLFHGSCSGYTGNVCGNNTYGIPTIKMEDGPQGFRGTDGTSTAWPSGMTVGATFDKDAANAWGSTMGIEFYNKGANVQLGPGLCLARVPRNGRNFEYISGEDPYLGYQMVGPVIKGIQSSGVIANAKHWVNNNQETQRGSVVEDVDERTQFEMYYPPFQGAIDNNVGSVSAWCTAFAYSLLIHCTHSSIVQVMCSYNKIRHDASGVEKWSCENPETLQRDLKDRMGFKGWVSSSDRRADITQHRSYNSIYPQVMSDWGATHSMSINAGLDQEMPGQKYMSNAKIREAMQSGSVKQAKIDDSALRVLTPLFAVGAFDKNNTNTPANNVSTEAHNQLAMSLSAMSTVLMKNDKGLLPLRAPSSTRDAPYTIAVIGKEAMGLTVHGGGSGHVNPAHVSAPLDSICAKLGVPALPPPAPAPNNCSDGKYLVDHDYANTNHQTDAKAPSVAACCALCASRSSPMCRAFSYVGDSCYMKAAAENLIAKKGVTAGKCHATPAPAPKPDQSCSPDGKKCVKYADGIDLASSAAIAKSADVAIVFIATSSSEGSDRKDLSFGSSDDLVNAVAAAAGSKTAVVFVTPGAALTPWAKDVAAVLTPFMPGQAYGDAISSVLFGDVNPSGRLPLTFPNVENEVNFTTSQWPGVNGKATYTEKLLVGYRWYDTHNVKPAFPFGHGMSYTTFGYSNLAVDAAGAKITVDITNTGKLLGAEVAQLYLGFPASAGEPPKQLKGLQKLTLAPGTKQTVTFDLTDRDLSIWDITVHQWKKISGDYGVFVGASSRDVRQTGKLTVA
jgi:beta-glucosidase